LPLLLPKPKTPTKKKDKQIKVTYQIIKPLKSPRESNKRITIIEHPHNQQKTRHAACGALEQVLEEARFEGSGGLSAFCEADTLAFYYFVLLVGRVREGARRKEDGNCKGRRGGRSGMDDGLRGNGNQDVW
jgi:hypothetical protein